MAYTAKKSRSILCTRCSHYYVTWDKRFPYGCKAMGFKSERYPCRVVQETSGTECQMFEQKKKKNSA